MKPLPPSQTSILEVLSSCGALTHKEIAERVDISPRTVRFALKKLKEKRLLIVRMNLHDMRQNIYEYRPAAPAEPAACSGEGGAG